METNQKLNYSATPSVEYTLLRQHIESLIFASSQPIPLAEIRRCVETVLNVLLPEIQILEEIQSLQAHYSSSEYAFEIVEINGGFQFLTKGAYHETISTYLRQTIKKKLSQPALETLAIVAYKQPISKTELEVIRGVNCDYAIQKLLEKELVHITGRSEVAGRPLLYGTSEKFMDYFGISSLKDLPKLKDLKQPENEIGVAE